MMLRNLIILLFLLPALTGCEQILMEKNPADDPVSNFEYLWKTIERKYSFFELKNIDWQAVYDTSRPKVRAETTDEELFDILAGMLYVLRDGHVNLVSDFDITRNWRFYLDRPQNFSYELLERNYLKEDFRITGPLINKVIDSIGYIYYGSFASPISYFDLEYVLNNFSGLKGVILDVRDNGGGSPQNAFTLISHFADSRRLVYTSYLKNGPGHNDFDPANPVYTDPKEDWDFNQHIVLLTNRSSFSATTFFAAMCKAYPHITVMGDTTGGGGGMPAGDELPNGWHFRYSASKTIMPDGWDFELGVPPDIVVYQKKEDTDLGFDTILEAALDFLK